MLKKMNIDVGEIGQYGAAIKLFSLGLIVNEVFFKQYYPKIISLYKSKMNGDLVRYVSSIQKMNVHTALGLCVFILLFSENISLLMFGKEFSKTPIYLNFLIIVVFFRFLLSTDSALLSSSNYNRFKVYLSLICSVANIALNLFLIPYYGVIGAIISTLFTEFLLAVLMKIFCSRLVLQIPIDYTVVFSILLVVLLAFTKMNVELNLILKITIALIVVLLLFIKRRTIYEPFFIKQ
jgi:O-antigen/teichoic acid export membrane protein